MTDLDPRLANATIPALMAAKLYEVFTASQRRAMIMGYNIAAAQAAELDVTIAAAEDCEMLQFVLKEFGE